MISSLFKAVKALFFVFIIIQFVPAIIVSVKQIFDNTTHPKTHIALLSVNGMVADAAYYTKRLDGFLKDEDVKGLILRINSPGGYSGCCQAIFNEVKHFAKKKPVVALVENVGASGSYYIAAAAHSIIASPLSLIGSIGVYMELANIRQLLANWHVECKYVQAGKYKTAGSMTKDLTVEEGLYLQKLSDDQYQCFVQQIAEARKLDAKQHTAWADGQIFTGMRALELKLIDKLGSITDALEEIKKLAKMDEHDQLKLVQAPRHTGMIRQLLIGNGDDTTGEGLDIASSVALFARNVTTQFCSQQAVGCIPTSI